MTHPLDEIVAANRRGEQEGITSVCSAHPLVLEAACERALADGSPLLVEATCNQVNQEGGYTGMTPADFRDAVGNIALRLGLPETRVILGGDHLGPSPWQDLPAEEAMARAEVMVADYAAAGFVKLHLDASMSCADDPEALDDATVAGRAARLAAAAERAAGEGQGWLRYVVGTEVPVPGGAQEHLDTLAVTDTADLESTLRTHREVFVEAGLEDAWGRVRAVVVQPGVEFGHTEVVDFAPESARDLSRAIHAWPDLVFEAHSTDYQTPRAYQQLVAGHFAILKVGPALTFALREALFALDRIAQEAPGVSWPVSLRETLEAEMLAEPRYWQAYYAGDPDEQRFARAYSLSDRCRYYWSRPRVAEAVEALFAALAAAPMPPTLISQYLPVQYAAIRRGELVPDPRAMVRHCIDGTLASFAAACRPDIGDGRRSDSSITRAQPAQVDSLTELTRRILEAAEGRERFLVALAGPPGAGKSYRSEQLFQAIDEVLTGQVVVVPMDGYHFDNAVLGTELLSVKGAPQTFDADGLRVDLERIRRAETSVAVPVFDRPLDLARAGGRLVTLAHRIVIVEGNYLLLDQAPWRRLHDLFDLRVMLEVDDATLERRLIERWLTLGHEPESARRKALDKDMPNARLIKTTSIPPDLAWC